MAGSSADGWEDELERWLAPFLAGFRRQAQRRWAPFYLKGLLLPGGRKSVEPMAARVVPGEVQQLHHVVSTSPWATVPLEDELVKAADRLVGGPGAVLVVDDTALVKQGKPSVGVKRQYGGQLGKKANCQSMVSLTLARREVPVGVGLRLFLPENWAGDAERVGARACRKGSGHARSGASRSMRSTACWPRAAASGACWPTRSTARRPSSAPGSPSGASPSRSASCADAEGLPRRRGAHGPRAQTDRPTPQAPRAFGPERAGGRAARGPAGGVPRRLVAHRDHDRQSRSSVLAGARAPAPARGTASGRVRRSRSAGGRWAGRGTGAAPTGRGGVARR